LDRIFWENNLILGPKKGRLGIIELKGGPKKKVKRKKVQNRGGQVIPSSLSERNSIKREKKQRGNNN